MKQMVHLAMCGVVLFVIQGSSNAIQVTSFVNESASFTITFPSQQQSVTLWQLNNGINSSVVQCSGSPCSCSATEFLNKTSLYNITCGTTYVTVTINHVQLEQHNDVWRSTLFGSNITYISFVYVNVRVSNVSLASSMAHSDETNTLTMNETNIGTFECQSSFCRPNATLHLRFSNIAQQDISIMPNNVSYTSNSDFWQTKVFFEVKLNRSMTEWNISCIATNDQGTNVTSRTFNLNIQYPPHGPPAIGGFSNGSVYTLIENTEGQLVCSIGQSNPPAKLTWDIENRATNISEIANISSTTVRWTASRISNSKFSCRSYHILSVPQYISVNVDVLYPPENVTINSIVPLNFLSQDRLRVIENIKINISCSAVSNPGPNNIYWSGLYSSLSSELQISSERNKTGNITCSVSNAMIELPKNKTTYGTISKTYSLDILYPPIIKFLQNMSVIEGNSATVACEVIPGSPSSPTQIIWSNSTSKRNESVLQINKIHRTDSGWYSCVANTIMIPTYGDTLYGIDSRQFYLEVLYSPEKIAITSITSPNSLIYNSISIIEETFLKLVCSADGNPMPSFSWSGLNASDTALLHIHSSRTKQGNCTCIAKNVMTEWPQNKTVVGMNSKTIYVDVLYPPDITNITETRVVEGADVIITCVVTPGKISSISIKWMRNQVQIASGNSLNINNVSRQHAGYLICIVNYTMVPTYGDPKREVGIRSIYIDVLYKPEILNFFVDRSEQNISVTVNENDYVRMVCILDSNPISTMKIVVRNYTISTKENTTTLEHVFGKSSCINTGIYVCSGHNFLNTHNGFSSRELRIFVNCSPRRSPIADLRQNITASQDGSASISFVSLAYPPPRFTWFRIANSTLIDANNGYSTTLNISENEMRTEFILIKVTLNDFGEYVLTINNTIGSYQQSFFLIHKEQINKDGESSDKSFAGIIAGVAVGSVLGTLGMVAVIYISRKWLCTNHRQTPNTSSEVIETNPYQNTKDMVELSSMSVGFSNVYESLQNTGPDQQYQQLPTHSFGDRTGQRMVYENLQLTSNERHHQVEEFAEEIPTAIQKIHKQSAD